MITGKLLMDWRASVTSERERRLKLPNASILPPGATIVVLIDTGQAFDGTARFLATSFTRVVIEVWSEDTATIQSWVRWLDGGFELGAAG